MPKKPTNAISKKSTGSDTAGFERGAETRPHYRASATVMDQVVREQVPGFLPAHALTTIHFIVDRYQNGRVAERALNWLLQHFEIAAIGRNELIE